MDSGYCYYCATTQSLANFTKSKIEIRRGVPKGRCRSCAKEKNRAYRLANPDKLRTYDQKRLRDPETVWRYRTATRAKKYGLTAAEYLAMYKAQGGCCAICEKHVPEPKDRLPGVGRTMSLVIDHCHASGEVRALLCKDCNVGLGAFRERPDLFTKAAAYLQRFKSATK